VIFVLSNLVIVQLFLILGPYLFFKTKGVHLKLRSSSRYSYFYQLLHIFFVISSKVLLPIAAVTLSYTTRSISGINESFDPYKDVSSTLLESDAYKYLTFATSLITFLEILCVTYSTCYSVRTVACFEKPFGATIAGCIAFSGSCFTFISKRTSSFGLRFVLWEQHMTNPDKKIYI
jgi:uncharacterized membrane protein